MQCVAGDNVSISLCLPHRIKLLGKNFTRLFSGPEANKVPDAQVHYWITHFNCILEGEGGSVAGLSPAMQRPLAPNLGKTWEKKISCTGSVDLRADGEKMTLALPTRCLACETSGLTSVSEHLHCTHGSKQQLPNKSLGVSLWKQQHMFPRASHYSPSCLSFLPPFFIFFFFFYEAPTADPILIRSSNRQYNPAHCNLLIFTF